LPFPSRLPGRFHRVGDIFLVATNQGLNRHMPDSQRDLRLLQRQRRLRERESRANLAASPLQQGVDASLPGVVCSVHGTRCLLRQTVYREKAQPLSWVMPAAAPAVAVGRTTILGDSKSTGPTRYTSMDVILQ
jgi:hypothetical protein